MVLNAPKWYKTHQNVSLGFNMVDRVRSLQKNSVATSWHELLHQFGPFCTEFRKANKRSLMHTNSINAPKRQFRVQWGGSGAFVAKNSEATSWHELLHQFDPFCAEFRKASKRFPNASKQYETHQNISLGSNGVDQMRSLRKILTRLRGTNFCINCTISTHF